MEDLETRLREVLDRHAEVRFALLFGSAATRGWAAARDIDVAVSFTRRVSLLERAHLARELEARVPIEWADLRHHLDRQAAGLRKAMGL